MLILENRIFYSLKSNGFICWSSEHKMPLSYTYTNSHKFCYFAWNSEPDSASPVWSWLDLTIRPSCPIFSLRYAFVTSLLRGQGSSLAHETISHDPLTLHNTAFSKYCTFSFVTYVLVCLWIYKLMSGQPFSLRSLPWPCLFNEFKQTYQIKSLNQLEFIFLLDRPRYFVVLVLWWEVDSI